MNYDLPNIRQALQTHFSHDELMQFMAEYFWDLHDDLSPSLRKSTRIEELVGHAQRRNMLEHLVTAMLKERPQLPASQYITGQPDSLVASAPATAAPIQRNQKQIFISHAHQNAEMAQRLATDLEKEGYAIWIAPDSIRPGEKWAEAISRGLAESGIFLLLLSPAAVQSSWVQMETNVAIQFNSKQVMSIYPLLIENCRPPALWLAYQQISLRGGYANALSHLLTVLNHRPAPMPAEPEIEVKQREPEKPKISEPTPTPSFSLAQIPTWGWAVAGLVGVVLAIIFALNGLGGGGDGDASATDSPAPQDEIAIVAEETDTPQPDPTNTATPKPTTTFSPTPTATSVPPTPTPTGTASPTPGPFVPVAVDGIEWVEIPAGPFMMGAAEGDDNADDDEFPLHEVTLDTYWIAKTEVTNAQYKQFVDATGHRTPDCVWEDDAIPDGFLIHPVVCVSWDDAIAYTEWLSTETGMNIALPSEAEWEKAARGEGQPLIYPWGNEFDASRLNASGASDGFDSWAPVGSFPDGASPYGVLDMSGNVWEWTSTIYDQDAFPYPYDAADGREDLTDGDVLRVLRGGSFFSNPQNVPVSSRDWNYTSSRNASDGFRVVVRPPSP